MNDTKKFKEISCMEALYGDLASVKTLNDIINLSIVFNKPVRVQAYYGDGKETSEILGNYSPDKEKTYTQHGGVISFYYNGYQYEIHVTSDVYKILDENGFTYTGRGSYLSGCAVPTDFQEFWYRQESEATYIWGNEIMQGREKAIKESISNATCTPIDEDLIVKRCFRVPKNGFIVRETRSDEKYEHKPFEREMNEDLTQKKLSGLVGKMSKYMGGGGYSGQHTFVYLDGYTYVTQSDKVIRELINHGFVESDDVKNIGIGWYREIEDPFYKDKYSEVMISDEEFSKKTNKSFVDRKIEYLEGTKKDLEDKNQKFIDAIIYGYRKYCSKLSDIEKAQFTLKMYVTEILKLELSTEIIDSIPDSIGGIKK